MELLLASTNLRGKYQTMLWLQLILLPFTTLSIIAGYAFLTKSPTILCRSPSLRSFSECSLTYYCENKNHLDMIIKDSLDNFAVEYSLFCERNMYNQMISSAFFFGCIIGALVWSSLPDIYGRYPIYKLLLYINLFTQINFLLRINIYHIIITAFLNGFCTYALNMQNVLVIELFDRKAASIAMSAMNAGYGIVGVFLGLYFLSVNRLTVLFVINISIVILCIILTHVYLTESPRWLNANHRVKEAIEVIKEIARINNTVDNFILFYEENKETVLHSDDVINVNGTRYSIIDVFKMKSQQWTLFGVMYVFFIIAICFYGIFITLNQSMDNFYLNTFLVFIGETIAEIGSGFLVNAFGRVKVTVIACHMGGIAFILSGFINKGIVKTILLFIASFGVAGALNIMYLYTNEVFPLTIRAVTFGFVYLLSRLGGVIVPVFINNNFYPYILGGLGISCGVVFVFMKETVNMELEDEVPEARVEKGGSNVSDNTIYK